VARAGITICVDKPLGGIVVKKFLAVFALVSCLSAQVNAQTYPDRPIKLLVPLAAGSAVDIVARLVADKMGDQLGQRPFVENMAGGAGVIGMRAGARATPDGYTVIVPNDSVLTMVPNMKSDAGYDPFADFMPVTQLVGIPLGLIAHPSFEANSVAELIALAKKTPGGVNYSSGGPGSPQHVGMELFVRAAGIQMTHVPHRGATEAVTAIMSGSVPVGITAMSAVVPLLPDKRVKLLAVTTAKRLPQVPDAPAIAETVPGFAFNAWCAFLVPAKTPPEIVARLNAATHAALNDPAVQKRLTELGFVVTPDSPEQLAAYMKQEYARTGNLIRDANLRN
jgi:tripartite-type tricarboxylate transporter receptor subunit TctC